MNRQQLQNFLRTTDPEALELLWLTADGMRRCEVGDAIHLRGLCEISSICSRRCLYCGLRADRQIKRDRMSMSEILRAAEKAVELGYGTIVLQAGEDPALSREWVAQVIKLIKDSTDLAITLSLGEQSNETLREWRDAGADRYLLRFETSNPELYRRIHPDSKKGRNRLDQLWAMHEMGYQVGSGFMIGVPGQTENDLVNDLLALPRLPLKMIGIGPYLPHPDTPLGQHPELYLAPPEDQVVATPLLVWKVIALARLQVPKSNIPATTALAVLDEQEGRKLALQRGANVVMPNITPAAQRSLYDIYPSKGRAEAAEQTSDAMTTFDDQLKRDIASIGRTVGTGRGDALWSWKEN